MVVVRLYSKCIFLLANLLVTLCVYGPNIPLYKNGELVGFYSPPKKYPTGRELKYSTAKHPLAGKMWFERMKKDKKDVILNGTAKILGGNGK